MIILDTNVLSEVSKPLPSRKVVEWLADQDGAFVFLTAITQAEVLYGVELLPAGKRRTRLAEQVQKLFEQDFSGRILPFDTDAAQLFAKIVATRAAAGRPIAQADAMIAAIAKARGAVFATRNVADFELCGIRLVNPWD